MKLGVEENLWYEISMNVLTVNFMHLAYVHMHDYDINIPSYVYILISTSTYYSYVYA